MSSDFKLHYDRLRENDPTTPKAETKVTGEGLFYDTASHARTLCLVWLDGKQQFLSYAYLVGGVFTPGEQMNEIILNFSTHVVTLKGYGLEMLFAALQANMLKEIRQEEVRYRADEGSSVSEISVRELR